MKEIGSGSAQRFPRLAACPRARSRLRKALARLFMRNVPALRPAILSFQHTMTRVKMRGVGRTRRRRSVDLHAPAAKPSRSVAIFARDTRGFPPPVTTSIGTELPGQRERS